MQGLQRVIVSPMTVFPLEGEGRSDVLMTLGVCYNAAKSILDELETTEFSRGQTKIESVAII